MYRFFLDALAAIRLRFFNLSHYRYPLTVIVAILFTLSVFNTAAASPVFGTNVSVLFFWLVITTVKWLLLNMVMRLLSSRPEQAADNWRGYIMLTDALIFPAILSFYWPQLALINMCWQIWIMIVQFVGFKRISQVNGLKLMGAYLVYGVLYLLCAVTIFVWFCQLGLLDLATIQQNLEQLMYGMPTLPQ